VINAFFDVREKYRDVEGEKWTNILSVMGVEAIILSHSGRVSSPPGG
jgi:hypothetical protein